MADKQTPFELGYRMPAEWARHEATWLSWPKDPDTFPEEILPEVERTYLQIISALHKNEKVNLLVDDEYYAKKVLKLLNSKGISKNVFIHEIPTCDVWFRDYGPIFITNKITGKDIAYTHWIFNAWGDKYEELKNDTQIPERISHLINTPRFKPGIVLEGGSIDTNGSGTFLTTEQCLLNPNRNPYLSKEEIEGYLKDYLGATSIIWLKDGIVGDDTDGHIDDIARFVNKGTIVCSLEENEEDENYKALKTNFELLESSTDNEGKKFSIVALPMPKPVIYKGRRLPASYTNFYIANNVVLMPTFNDPNDQKALGILQKLFHDREVIGINSRALVYGFGGIHCITQQQPKIN